VSTIVVIAKAPVPGRVKTRLSPALPAPSAAAVAAAALADTLDAVRAAPAARRVVALSGTLPWPPPGFYVVAQRGEGLGRRLAAAFVDANRLSPGPVLLIGMDTPQVTAALLGRALVRLSRCPAVMGPAADGGWWALGLQDVGHAAVLADVPMSTSDTGAATLDALRRRGVDVARLPVLRDVDTIADATSVAAAAPGTRFSRMLADVLVRQQEPA
jgi:rSAM/selenodomain-associated transferase 1